LQEQFLATDDIATIYQLLRLDPSLKCIQIDDVFVTSIVEKANLFKSVVNDVNLEELRSKTFETKVKHLIKPREKKKLDEFGSDEDDTASEGDTASEEEGVSTGACQLCNNLMADVFCEDCNQRICELCLQDTKHSKTHTVQILE